MKKLILTSVFIVFWASSFSQKIDKAFIKAHTYKNLAKALKNPDKVYGLDLHAKRLRVFPREIFKFKNLVSLDLRDNEIKMIPESIGNLKNLKDLSMFTNKLTKVPGSIGKLKQLKVLDLGNNPLETLPPEIAQLTELKKLYLQSTRLSKKNRRKIKRSLPNCSIRFSWK